MALPPADNNKITLSFGWQGPNQWHGGWDNGGLDAKVVDLKFANAKSDISVHIPDNISPTTIQKFPYTVRRYSEQEMEIDGRKFKPLKSETTPEFLNVTVDQIRNLKLKIGIFEQSPNKGPMIMDNKGRITQEKRVLRSDRKIQLELPTMIEVGQEYSLVVASKDFSFSAALVKAVKVAPQEGKKAIEDEYQQRLRKMGEALISESFKNINLALSGGVGVFNSSSTPSDVAEHMVQGIVRAAQQHVNPELKVPTAKPAESEADLDKLSKEELQKRFEVAFNKDRELEKQRNQAAISGNIPELNRLLEIESANTQLVVKLAQAIEKKGGKALIPIS